MSLEYFKLSNLDFPFHSYPLSEIGWGLFVGTILIFGGYKLAGAKGAFTLVLGGVILFALMNGMLPI